MKRLLIFLAVCLGLMGGLQMAKAAEQTAKMDTVYIVYKMDPTDCYKKMDFYIERPNTNPYYIDWGDGMPIEGSTGGYNYHKWDYTVKGEILVKIYVDTLLSLSFPRYMSEMGCSPTGGYDCCIHDGNFSYTIQHTVLQSVDVSNCKSLQRLETVSGMTELNVSGCTALTELILTVDQTGHDSWIRPEFPLKKLDITGCTALEKLVCRWHQLEELDASDCTALKQLICYNNNQLKKIHVNSAELTELRCDTNQLTELVLTNCTALKKMICNNNQLTELDLTDCISLKNLYCNNNQLTKLNLDNCTALYELYCNNNQLTELDLTDCTGLVYLYCDNNQLASLDLSQVIWDIYFTRCTFENNYRTVIVEEGATFNLNTLPGFDVTRIKTPIVGGSVSGNELTFIKDTVIYSYYTAKEPDVIFEYSLVEFGLVRKLAVVKPVFTPAGGEVEKGTTVTISCATDNAVIHYTTDGTVPTEESSVYSEPIVINAAMTIKAIAVRENYVNSEVAEASFTIMPEVAMPVFTPNGGEVEKGTTVTISCATDNATIHYTTDGSTPTAQSAVYGTPIVVNEAMTIKAMAMRENYVNSAVATATFTMKPVDPIEPEKPDTVKMPVFNPNGGEVEKGATVTISCATENATIYYTTDGSTPTAQSAVYGTPIVVNEAMTIKAMAMRENYVNSAVSTATFTIKSVEPIEPEKPDTVAKPVFTPKGGEVERGSSVTIHCDTANATIHYTTDGSVPTAQSTVYSTPIAINEAMTLKAVAMRENYVNSPMAEATFTIKPIDPVDPAANEAEQTSGLVVYAQDRTICLSEEAGEVSVYTVDGRRVFCGKAVRIPVSAGGIYIVRVAGRSYKLPVR